MLNYYQFDKSIGNLVSNEMEIYFDMFGSLMKDVIACNVYGGLIVTKDESMSIGQNLKVLKQLGYPNEFTGCGCQGTIFCHS